MSDGYNISIQGLDELRAQLDARTRLMEDPGPLLDRFGLYMLRSVDRNFRDGGRPVKWPASRSALANGTNTLMPTGRNLRASITYTVEGARMRMGTNFIGARLLHFGGVVEPKTARALRFTGADGAIIFARRVRHPARPFMMIHERDARAMVRMADQAIEDMKPNGALPDTEVPA